MITSTQGMAKHLVDELRKYEGVSGKYTGVSWFIPAAAFTDEIYMSMDEIHQKLIANPELEYDFVANVIWRVALIGINYEKGFGMEAAVEVMNRVRYQLAWHVKGTSGCQKKAIEALKEAFKAAPTACATNAGCLRLPLTEGQEEHGCSPKYFIDGHSRASAHMMSIAGLCLMTTCSKSNHNEWRIGVAILRNPDVLTLYF